MPNNNNPASPRLPITPELVRKVADLVYQQWVRELQIDHERSRAIRGGRQPRRMPGAGR